MHTMPTTAAMTIAITTPAVISMTITIVSIVRNPMVSVLLTTTGFSDIFSAIAYAAQYLYPRPNPHPQTFHRHHRHSLFKPIATETIRSQQDIGKVCHVCHVLTSQWPLCTEKKKVLLPKHSK